MTEKQIFDYLVNAGMTQQGVAGLMGNLQAESGLRSNNLQNSCEKRLGMSDETYTKAVDNCSYRNFVNDSAGYGLAQWTSADRKQNLLNFAKMRGTSIGDMKMQLDFLVRELTMSYKVVMNTLISTRSIQVASDTVLSKFEMPKDQSDTVRKLRASYGQKIYDRCATVETKIYRVQCGAFTNKDNAERLRKELAARGRETMLVKSGIYWKIQCGAFEVEANAAKLRDEIVSDGYEAIIV